MSDLSFSFDHIVVKYAKGSWWEVTDGESYRRIGLQGLIIVVYCFFWERHRKEAMQPAMQQGAEGQIGKRVFENWERRLCIIVQVVSFVISSPVGRGNCWVCMVTQARRLRHIIMTRKDFHHAVSLDFCFEFTTKVENSTWCSEFCS